MRDARPVMRALHPEWLAAAVLVAAVSWAGVAGWRAYDTYLRPAARAVPTSTPTPIVDPEVAREQGRRQRQVQDHVGAGIALRNVNPRAAAQEFMNALALDPSNFEARQNLREMGIEPPPGPGATATPPRPTPLPTVTPLFQR